MHRTAEQPSLCQALYRTLPRARPFAFSPGPLLRPPRSFRICPEHPRITGFRVLGLGLDTPNHSITVLAPILPWHSKWYLFNLCDDCKRYLRHVLLYILFEYSIVNITYLVLHVCICTNTSICILGDFFVYGRYIWGLGSLGSRALGASFVTGCDVLSRACSGFETYGSAACVFRGFRWPPVQHAIE